MPSPRDDESAVLIIGNADKVNTSVKPQHMVVKVPWDEQMELEEEAREKVRKATRL